MGQVLEPIGSGEEWTSAQMTHLLDLYEKMLGDLGYTAASYPDTKARVSTSFGATPRFDCLTHALWMCGCIRRFLRECRYARAYRWIGMVQGLLFMGGVYSLDELSRHEALAFGAAPRRVRDVPRDDCPPPAR